MAKKNLMLLVSLLIVCAGLTGCYTTGKAAGEAANQVEKGTDSMKKGYEEGKKSE
ncbi:MAG: hypothetical protein WAK95_08040 [Desulfobacterales bacterium]